MVQPLTVSMVPSVSVGVQSVGGLGLSGPAPRIVPDLLASAPRQGHAGTGYLLSDASLESGQAWGQMPGGVARELAAHDLGVAH